MIFRQTEFPGLFLIEPKVHGDARGYFFESFLQEEFTSKIGPVNFIQENESKSGYGVLRGLHFQRPPFTQAKLVRCISGSVLDVVVDLRQESPTYQKWYGITLSDRNKLQLYIPQGFAHGFAVLSEEAIFSYKVDNQYAPSHDAGIRFDDPALNIDWHLPANEIRLSAKDRELPLLSGTDIPNFPM